MFPFFLSKFNETWIFSTIFRKILKYQIQRNSVQWQPSCSLRTNRQTEMAKLTVVFLKSASGPKYDYFLIHNYVVGLHKGPGLFSLSKERTMVFYVYNLDARQSPRQCHGSRSQPSASQRGCLRSWPGSCGICGGKIGSGTDVSSGTSVFSIQYHSTNAPYSFSSSNLLLTDGWTAEAFQQK
jgi:hypothetical protein